MDFRITLIQEGSFGWGMNVGDPMESVRIFGVRVDPVTKKSLIPTVLAWVTHATQKTIFYVNAHCLNISCTDSSYHNILNQADLVYPDGIGVVWASRWLNGPRLEKITGRDWFDDICQLADANRWALFFLAGRPGVADQAAEIVKDKYRNLSIKGTADGYFSEKNEADVLTEIKNCQPDIVFVGMGTPVQEKWISFHRRDIQAPIVWGVGALFDTMVGLEPSVPGWLNDINLEWLWRMCIDPRGKWRRYLIGNPKFVLRVLRQKIAHR